MADNILDQYRAARPDLANVSDQDLIGMIHQASGVGGSAREYARNYLGIENHAGIGTDTAIDLGKGVLGLGQAAMGVANLATAGLAGKVSRATLGGDLEDASNSLNKYYSDKRQDAEENIQNAKGFWNTAKAYVQNPRAAIGEGIQAIPSMAVPVGVEAKVAKGVLGAAEKATIGAPIARAAAMREAIPAAEKAGSYASAATWGGLSAGQTADQVNHSNPDDPGAMYGAAIGSGLAVGAITHGFSLLPGGHMAEQADTFKNRLGLSVGNQAGMMSSMNAAQTGITNVATGKDWDEGMGSAIAGGLVSGAAFGLMGAKQRPTFEDRIQPYTDAAAKAAVHDTQFESGWNAWAQNLEDNPPPQPPPATLYTNSRGETMGPDALSAYQQFGNNPVDIGSPAKNVSDPGAAKLAEVTAASTKPEDAPVTQEERDAILAKHGEATPNYVGGKLDQHGNPLHVGYHFDVSAVPDKNGNVKPFLSPEKLQGAIDKLAIAERDKPEAQRAAEQQLSDVMNKELGRRPTSRELAKIVNTIDLPHAQSVEQLVGHIDVALAAMEGAKKPDSVVKDALTAWRKHLDSESPSHVKVAEPAKEGEPQSTEPVEVPQPAEVHAAEALKEILKDAPKPIALPTSTGQPKVVRKSEYKEDMANWSDREKERVRLVTGHDEEGNQIGQPMTHADIAKYESEKYGKAISEKTISNWLNRKGITKDVVDKFANNNPAVPEAVSPNHEADIVTHAADESNGLHVAEKAGDIHKAGFMDEDAPAYMKRMESQNNKFFDSKNVPEKKRNAVTDDAPTATDLEIEQRKKEQAEQNNLLFLKQMDSLPYKEAAQKLFDSLRTRGGHGKFDELKPEQKAWFLEAYRISREAEVRGADELADSTIHDAFHDIQKEVANEQSAHPEGRVPSDLGSSGSPENGPDRSSVLQPGSAESGAEVQRPAGPAVTVKRKRTTVIPEDAKFGKEEGHVENPYTADELKSELHEFMGTDSLGKNVIIVDTPDQLHDLRDVTIGTTTPDAFGWTRDGKAILVASRIEKGNARAAFLHEVGAHLGIERMLDGGTRDVLWEQLEAWAESGQGIEGEIARAAKERMKAADVPKNQTISEMIAYTVEEAVKRGIDPTATSYKTPLDRWFRTLWASFKKAIRRVFGDTSKLTAQDMVDLAYGAARLETTGTWHGAAAKFRKFDHSYMGTGEGAQVYGWGTYSAERKGVAESYLNNDVMRKGSDRHTQTVRMYMEEAKPRKELMAMGEAIKKRASSIVKEWNEGPVHTVGKLLGAINAVRYGFNYHASFARAIDKYLNDNAHNGFVTPDTVREAVDHILNGKEPEGLLHRLDFDIKPDEWLHYDKPMKEQSDTVKQGIAKLIKEQLGVERDSTWENSKSTGKDVYEQLQDDLGSDKQASELLHSYGIKGSKHYDGESRQKYATQKHSLEEHQKAVTHADEVIQDLYRQLEEIKGTEDQQPKEFQRLHKDIESWQDYKTEAQHGITEINRELDTLTHNRVAFRDRDIQRVMGYKAGKVDQVHFGKNAAVADKQAIDSNLQRLPAQLRKPVRGVMATIHDLTIKGAQASAFMQDLADWGGKHGLPAMKHIADVMAKKGAYKVELDQKLGDVVKGFQDLSQPEQDKVQAFLKDSTFEQRWGYKPAWRPDVKVDATAEKQYKALSPEARKIADDVFKHNHDMLNEKQRAIQDLIQTHYTELAGRAKDENVEAVWKEMESKMKDASRALMEGPYVPLKRFGSQVVAVKSKALLAAKDEDSAKYRTMLDDPNHYRVEHHDTIYSAENRRAELAEQLGDSHVVERSEKENHEYMGAGFETLQRLAESVKASFDGEGYSPEEKKLAHATYRALHEAIIQSLGEYNARTSTLQRKYIAGVDSKEMMRGFATQGYADNNFLSSMKHNKELQDHTNALRAQVKDGTGDRTIKQQFYNELLARRAANMNANTPRWVGHAMRFTTVWKLITSPAYYLQYLSQPLTMFLPLINGDHGYGAGVSEFTKAAKDTAAMAKGLFDTDLTKVKDAGERKMLETLRSMGTIAIGHDQQFGHLQTMPGGKFSKAWQSATDKITQLPHSVEMHNRIASALAAYRLEMAKHGDAEKAAQYAKDKVFQAYGDYSSYNAPRIMQGGGMRKLVMQYRQFQLIHTALLTRLMNNAFAGASPEEKHAARLQLTYMAGHYGVLAGALGIPAAHAVAGVVKSVFGDDNDVDIETFVNRHTGNKFLADMILGGVPRAALGQDLSTRMGAGDILSPFRYNDMGNALQSKKDYKDFMTAAMGPFIGGMVPQLIDGANAIRKGNYYNGLEQLMPKGIGDVMKAYRFAEDGVIDRKGQTVVNKDDVGVSTILGQALGSRPTQVEEPQHEAAVVGGIMQKFKDQENTLKSQFVAARKSGDDTGSIVEKWQAMQEKQRQAGLKPSTMGDLYKAASTMNKRDRMMINGVPFRKTNRTLVQDIAGNE
jgi:hypothetical protein